MDYYFNNFKFNSLSLVLTQNDQPLPIRNNEAKLLAFFLANPGQVYSKDAILENVWAGKIVSEQAVFQAISNLRTLICEDAIKTFPKKGYQWQIPLHAGEPTAVSDNSVPLIPQQTQSYWSSYWSWSLALLGSLGFAAVIFFSLYQSTSPSAPTPILFAPFTLDPQQTGTADIAGQLNNAMIEQVNLHKTLVVHKMKMPSGDQAQQVSAAPGYFLERSQQSTDATLLVTGNIRQHEQTFYLSWVMQGRNNQWRGYLSGQSITELAGKLEALLNKVASIKVLWESSDVRLINAQLQLLHSEDPDDLIIHYRLIEHLLNLGDTNSTRIQAEELELRAQKAGNVPYQSLALLMQVIVGYQTVPAEKQRVLLDKAVALAESTNDVILQSRLMERYATIYYELKDFAALEDKLLRALALAESSPEQRLKVLRALIVFSFKFHHEDKGNEYLKRARTILDGHKLPAEFYAQIDILEGSYTQDDHQKEFFYRTAVNRFTPEEDAWDKEMAQRHLVDHYINGKRWADALAVLATEKNLSGAELYMQAQIYFKQNEIAKAQEHAEAAFKKANLQGEYMASLEAALLSAQIYKQTNKPDLQKNMRKFIENNALESWRKEELEQLDAMQINNLHEL